MLRGNSCGRFRAGSAAASIRAGSRAAPGSVQGSAPGSASVPVCSVSRILSPDQLPSCSGSVRRTSQSTAAGGLAVPLQRVPGSARAAELPPILFCTLLPVCKIGIV